MYGCLIDALKAVDQNFYLKKLLTTGLPSPVLRFLFGWHQSQRLHIRWNGHLSESFKVSRGVRQGDILSPILFTLYLDNLLIELARTNCYWDDMFVGALAYVDDITLLAPTPSALRKLLAVCESIGTNHMLKFIPDKTQCIRFSQKSSGGCSSVRQVH